MKKNKILTWEERCEKHPQHQSGMITNKMIQDRMQEEIDELRQQLEKYEMKHTLAVKKCIDGRSTNSGLKAPLEWLKIINKRI